MCVNTSIRQVGPVDDSVPLQVPIESLSGQRHPGDGDDLWGLCQSQDIVRRPRRHYQRHERRKSVGGEDLWSSDASDGPGKYPNVSDSLSTTNEFKNNINIASV